MKTISSLKRKIALSLLVLFSVCGIVGPSLAQGDNGFPADEKTFMAEVNAAYKAGNTKRYLDMLRVGVKRGYTEAEVYSASFFLFYPGTTEEERNLSYRTGRALSERTAKKGHPWGMFLFALTYQNGWGVPKDMNMYKYWLIKAANAGNETAQRLCEEEKIKYRTGK